eukprot:256135_1
MSVLGKRALTGLDDSEDNNMNADSLEPPHKKQKVNPDNHLRNGGVIMLNVGGVKYQTTIQTLTGYTSMLKARFSSKFAQKPSDDGSYFVDGDGELFRYILKYLRTGTLLLPSAWKRDKIWEFYVEVKYFTVESLFNKVLLKLFNSSIVTNDTLKLQVIRKIEEVFKWKGNMSILESVNEWKCIGSLTSKYSSYAQIGHALCLIQAKYKIYGLLITRFEKGGSWWYDFDRSFAFDCGRNSYHLLSTCNTDFEFQAVRKLTTEERKVDEENREEDGQYTWFMPLSPMQVRGTVTKNKGSYSLFSDTTTQWMVKYGHGEDDKYTSISKSELWSIPLAPSLEAPQSS